MCRVSAWQFRHTLSQSLLDPRGRPQVGTVLNCCHFPSNHVIQVPSRAIGSRFQSTALVATRGAGCTCWVNRRMPLGDFSTDRASVGLRKLAVDNGLVVGPFNRGVTDTSDGRFLAGSGDASPGTPSSRKPNKTRRKPRFLGRTPQDRGSFRNPLLYPAELRAQVFIVYVVVSNSKTSKNPR